VSVTTPSTRPPSASAPGPTMGSGSGDAAFGGAGLHGGFEDGADPELLALPAPPKRERTLTVLLLLVTAAASLAMVFALARDAAYGISGFSSRVSTESGCTSEVTTLEGEALRALSNQFACGKAQLGAGGGVRFERPFATDSYRVLPALGRQDLWVEVRVPHGKENGRYVPPSFVQGRMVRFDEAGLRHRGLVSAIDMATGTKVPAGAFLLVADELPANARWACVLVLMFAAFFGWNVVTAARLVRKVR